MGDSDIRNTIDTFRADWRFIRQMTHDFIQAVPDPRWEFSPHSDFAPFHKQVRHLVCMQGVYNHGLRNQVTDFGRKHSHYVGGIDRGSLLAALRDKDAELASELDAIAARAQSDYPIEFFGRRTLASFLRIFIQHESIHHGQWSFYAALGDFETPESWKLNWGL